MHGEQTYRQMERGASVRETRCSTSSRGWMRERGQGLRDGRCSSWMRSVASSFRGCLLQCWGPVQAYKIFALCVSDLLYCAVIGTVMYQTRGVVQWRRYLPEYPERVCPGLEFVLVWSLSWFDGSRTFHHAEKHDKTARERSSGSARRLRTDQHYALEDQPDEPATN